MNNNYNITVTEYSKINHKQNLSKEKLNYLILNYLVIEGYEDAAINFSKEIRLDISQFLHSNDQNDTILRLNDSIEVDEDPLRVDYTSYPETFELTKAINGASGSNSKDDMSYNPRDFDFLKGLLTISKRNEIKVLILNGKIQQAIHKINEYFPTLLEINSLLYFKLLRLNLIEMIREHKLSETNNERKEKEFLNSIIFFVKDKVISEIINNKDLLKELEMTMSLLCFDFSELPKELSNLFDLGLRTKISDAVNKSILNLSFISNYNDLKKSTYKGMIHGTRSDEDTEMDGAGSSKLQAENSMFDENTELLQELTQMDELIDESNLERILKLWSWSEGKLDELGIRYPKVDISDYRI